MRGVGDGVRLRRLAHAVARHDRMADLLPELHLQALDVTGGRASVLLRLNPRTNQLQAASASGLDDLDPLPWLADVPGQAAADRAWTEGSPVVVSDLSDLTDRLGSPAAMVVPLLNRHERMGLLVVAVSDLERAQQAGPEMTVVGDLLSMALERAKLQRDVALQQDVRELVAELARSVSSSRHLNASLEIFCDRAGRLFSADRVSVWLHDRRARTLELSASSDGAHVAPRRRVASDDTTAHVSRVMRGTGAEIIASPHGVTPDVLVPLKGRRRALGTLELSGVRVDAGDEIDLLDRLEEVGRQLSTAIENVWLLEDVLRSRRELENTFNSLADLVFVSDTGLRVTHANQAVAVRLGRRAADLIEHPLAEFFGPDLVNWVAQLGPTGGQIESGYESREFEDPVLNGTFLFTVSPLIGRDDKRIGHVIVARDVTDHARLEAERAELRDRLTQSEKLAALGQFVAGIAHELNNPLQGVIGHVELLLQDSGPSTTRFRRDLRLVFREADRAAKIVHNLLVFAGSRRIKRRRLNANHVVTKVLTLRATACAAARIEVVKNLSPTLPRIAGDALLLQQAVLNIVVNAEQALAAVTGTRRLEIRTRPTVAKGIEIVITDSGPGVPSEALPRLFEPFFTTKEVGQGTGLGLAIAYGIVQEHAGQLRVTNLAGGGAAFTIELPSGAKAVE